MTATVGVPTPAAPDRGGEPGGIVGWLTSTDHKRIAALTLSFALVMMLGAGVLAMLIRAQLAQPNGTVLSPERYDQVFTMHGSMMIYLVMTPFAIAAGLYFVPLQIGAPNVAAPRTAMFSAWLYLLGGVTMLSGFLTDTGAADQGWYSYLPLASSRYTPGPGVSLWVAGVALSGTGLLIMAGTVLWTALLKRTPGMSMLRMPVFTWTMVVTTMMVIGAFPALLGAIGMLVVGRIAPAVVGNDSWAIAYQQVFWFFGHPVVYVMFFPFVGAVAEVLATFGQRRFFGYKAFVLSQLAFAAFGMSAWAHHMFATGQASDYYFSLTSIALVVPAGIEYFDLVVTVLGSRLRFPTANLFAVTFIPQFLIGGLTGIMTATPAIDYQITDSYFIVAHWHYTLAAGSLFGLFAGIYFWWPKITGRLLREPLGKTHFVLWVVGTNLTFLPQFWLGLHGMPRRIATYLPEDGFTTDNLISSIGAGILGLGALVFIVNVVVSTLRPRFAGDDPWGGHTLEWATSSPPPRYNFDAEHPVPPIHSYAPLLDIVEAREDRKDIG